MILKIVGISPNASPKTIALLSFIAPGSVMVSITREHKVPDPKGAWVYFEGGIYSRNLQTPPTLEEKTEYARIAAGRASKNYPTVAKVYIPDAETDLVPLGYVDTETGTVEL